MLEWLLGADICTTAFCLVETRPVILVFYFW